MNIIQRRQVGWHRKLLHHQQVSYQIMTNWKKFEASPIFVPHHEEFYHSWLDEVSYKTPIKFETVSHVTTFENAETILDTRELKSHRVNDYSCITKIQNPIMHPLYTRKILWVCPDTYSSIQVEKHGNIRFYSNNLDFMRNLNFYMVEFLDDGNKNTARVLATPHKYRDLLQFDVKSESNGPIFLDQNGNFVKYKLMRRSNWLQYENFDIEILLEIADCVTTLVSYTKCNNPKLILKSGHSLGPVEAYNDAIGELKYALFRYRHRSNTAFFINPLDPHCKDALEIVTKAELTSQWYPMTRNTSFHSNNADELVKRLVLFDSWENDKVILRDDEQSIEDLHFVYTETGELPSSLAMIHKLVDTTVLASSKRNLYGNNNSTTSNEPDLFQEIFELFLDHFKTHEAQKGVKITIGKFIEAAYNLDMNRSLHGSQLPLHQAMGEKLKM